MFNINEATNNFSLRMATGGRRCEWPTEEGRRESYKSNDCV